VNRAKHVLVSHFAYYRYGTIIKDTTRYQSTSTSWTTPFCDQVWTPHRTL